MDNFYEYMEEFEQRVIVVGIENVLVGKTMKVSVRPGKLSAGHFGRMMGALVTAQIPFALDYYGYTKRSTGFYEMIKREAEHQEQQIKSIEATVVHFASIKMETIDNLAADLLVVFPRFKDAILKLRGFGG